MADVTGPIHTLAGASHALPDGVKCDDHPDRLATHRVQGETDSFGCELYDLCDECYQKWKAHGIYKPDFCEWCKEAADDCRPQRDYDEGMRGPVYYVCGKCRRRYAEEAEEELRESGYHDEWWPDDEDDYEDTQIAEDIFDPPAPVRPKVRMTCKACRQPWAPKHDCRTRLRRPVDTAEEMEKL